MADYAPQAIDISDVGQIGLGGGPAMQAHFAGLARRNPHLLAGFAQGERGQARDILNRAYSENADVNEMLNQLAQGEQFNEYRKNDLDYLKKALDVQAANGYRGGAGLVHGAAGFGDLGQQIGEYNLLGDTSALEGMDALARNRLMTGEAAMTSARANAADVANKGKTRSEFTYDALNRLVPKYVTTGIQSAEQFARENNIPLTSVVGEGGQGIRAAEVGDTGHGAVINTQKKIMEDGEYTVIDYEDGYTEVLDPSGQPAYSEQQ